MSKFDNYNSNSPLKHRCLKQQISIKHLMVKSIFLSLSRCTVFFVETLYGRTSLASQGAVERSTVIAAISIIFIIGISISLFIIYRSCYVEYVQKIYGSASFGGLVNSPESIYGGLRSTSQVCRYDMGRRSGQRFDESFFVSNVEPLGAYRRQF